MTDEEKMLATALRDLCGWHVGMVTTDGYAFDQNMDAADLDDELPALDSPANWGHWGAWALERELSVDIVPQMPSGSGRFAISIDRLCHVTGSFAEAFLRAFVATVVDSSDAAALPPSAFAWWREHGQ